MARPRKSKEGLPIGVYRKNNAWAYKARNADERAALGAVWTRLGKTVDEALQNYWPRVGETLRRTGGMQDLWERYLSEVVPHKSKVSQQDNLKRWRAIGPVVKNMHPKDINRVDAIAYLEKRALTSTSGARQEIAMIRHMLNKALDWGIIDVNPLAGLRISDYVKAPLRDRTPHIWELEAVIKHATPQVALFIDFKYQTGLDQSTCFGLKVPSFDGQGLAVKRSKTHKKGYVEWTDDFIETCQSLIKLNDNRSEYLFCNTFGGKVSRDIFSRNFRECVQKAIDAGDLQEPFVPNDIRSSHATDAEEIHGLDASKQLLNGPGAKKHYVHLRHGDKVQPLPSLRKGKSGQAPKK